jgi:hypothetical protein
MSCGQVELCLPSVVVFHAEGHPSRDGALPMVAKDSQLVPMSQPSLAVPSDSRLSMAAPGGPFGTPAYPGPQGGDGLLESGAPQASTPLGCTLSISLTCVATCTFGAVPFRKLAVLEESVFYHLLHCVRLMGVNH